MTDDDRELTVEEAQAIAADLGRPDDNRRCSVCLLPYDDCRARWLQDHEFFSLLDARQNAIPPPQKIRESIHRPTDSQEPADG